MTITEIISIGVIAIVLVIGAALAIKKFFALPVAQRKDLIIHWLTGAVVVAQNSIKEHTDEANKAKFNQVLEEFQNKAPLLYKLFIKFTSDLNLDELIEEALQNIKNTKF